MGFLSSLFGGGSSSGSSYTPYQFKPYTGYTPPHTYTSDPTGEYAKYLQQYYPESLSGLIGEGGNVNVLQPTNLLTHGLIANRAQGQDVGYAPEWMDLNTGLIKSELGRSRDDALRSAKGSLSAAGLSGNPRAYEATAGRVNRDYTTDLSNSLAKLSIADLERKNQERDVNTERLRQLNSQNFSQENNVADFELRKYLGEENARANAYTTDLLGQKYYDTLGDQASQGTAGFITEGAQALGPTLQAMISNSGTTGSTGSGIALRPGDTGYGQLTPSQLSAQQKKLATYRNVSNT